jgi:RND family efflux transporter MFP subunit
LLVACLAGGGGYYWWRGSVAATPADHAAVATVQPAVRKVDALVSATGVIRLRVGAEVRVGSQLSGIVRRLNVTVGSHITKGDVIAEIDSRNLEARHRQVEAEVRIEEVELERARVNLERARTLSTQDLVPRQQVEDLALAVQAAQAKLEKARRDFEAVDTEMVYARILAPISGTVASVSTQEGETVAAAFSAPTFVTIIADAALQLVAMVDETDIAGIRRGNPVTFTVEAYGAQEFEGAVNRVAPKATIVSGVVNYEVVIDLKKDADLLKPDMTANVSVKTAQHDALVVPSAGVQRDGDERFVYVDHGGAFERRVVTVGVREAGFTEIRTGLGPAERVVPGPLPAAAQRGEPAR